MNDIVSQGLPFSHWGQSSNHSTHGEVTVVLTGATGFLGKALLTALVQDPRVVQIHCIAVRRPESHTDPVFQDAKVSLHQGDLGQPMLGLSTSETDAIFDSPREDVVIIHNGADVSFLKPYFALRRANVGSTRALVRMAARYRRTVAAMHYISTAGVAQFMTGHATVGEQSMAEYQTQAATMGSVIGAGYAASKWASEVLLEKAACALGLPVTVHRPTNITSSGGSNDDVPASDVVQSLLRYSRTIGAVPLSDVWDTANGEQLDFVSVETVAEGVVRAAVENASVPPLNFVHHAGEVQIPLRAVGRFLEKQTGRPLRVVPLAVWVAEAEMAGLDPLWWLRFW